MDRASVCVLNPLGRSDHSQTFTAYVEFLDPVATAESIEQEKRERGILASTALARADGDPDESGVKSVTEGPETIQWTSLNTEKRAPDWGQLLSQLDPAILNLAAAPQPTVDMTLIYPAPAWGQAQPSFDPYANSRTDYREPQVPPTAAYGERNEYGSADYGYSTRRTGAPSSDNGWSSRGGRSAAPDFAGRGGPEASRGQIYDYPPQGYGQGYNQPKFGRQEPEQVGRDEQGYPQRGRGKGQGAGGDRRGGNGGGRGASAVCDFWAKG